MKAKYRKLIQLSAILIFILLFFSVKGNVVLASESETPSADQSWLDNLMDKVGSGDEYDPEKMIDFGILPGPFYTPEMQLGLGIAAVGLYSTNRSDPDERISTLSISGFASINGSVGMKVENQSFFQHDRYRLFIDTFILRAPNKYWGVGYDLNNEYDLNEDYDERALGFSPRFYARVTDDLFFGVGWDIEHNKALNTEDGGLFFQENPYGTEIYSSGVSLHLMYDTRDFIPNPYKGHLFNIDYYDYKEDFGSDTNFTVVEVTANKYWAISEKNIIAVQGYLRSAGGNAPWSQVSQIGGPKQMRGYWEGRYRDKRMVTTQIEYRRNIIGRHGFVVWAGAGVIAPEFDEFESDQILPNAGIGYRLAFKYRSNVRLDLGFGKDGEMGFYFNVNEAF